MALMLPNETKPRFWGALLAILAVFGLAALGCATQHARPAPDEGAAFVERDLRREGLRFGTDGGYLSSAHQVVAAASARPGDVLFFDTRASAAVPSCDDAGHAGIVQAVSHDGRITFVEARGGRVRRSYADPVRPTLRRDGRGQIANTFLRPKRMDDPTSARYFAGEMLCGVARPHLR